MAEEDDLMTLQKERIEIVRTISELNSRYHRLQQKVSGLYVEQMHNEEQGGTADEEGIKEDGDLQNGGQIDNQVNSIQQEMLEMMQEIEKEEIRLKEVSARIVQFDERPQG